MLGYERSRNDWDAGRAVRCPRNRELVQHGDSFKEEGSIRALALRKDGSVFPVETAGWNKEWAVEWLRLMAIRDISDRKKAEAEIREAKEYAEAILDSLPGTFYVFDEQLRLTRWNKKL